MHVSVTSFKIQYMGLSFAPHTAARARRSHESHSGHVGVARFEAMAEEGALDDELVRVQG